MQMSACSTQQSALETAESASTSLQSASETAHSATASLQSGLETAESAIATSEGTEVQENGVEKIQENGVEETSMTASQVIQKFEATSKSSSEVNIMAISSVSSHLLQDTVSSRMKKISAEEYAIAERKNTQKTGKKIISYCYSVG